MKAYTKDKISENLLLVFGLCSIIISVVSLLGIWSYISDKRIIDILLAVVGAISVSLSFDRSGHFRKVDQHIEKVEKIIKRASGGRIISGPEEIYAATIEPLNKAQQSIKAIVCGDPNKAPKRFSEAVATRLTAARDAGNPVYYQVVFATPSATSPEFLSRVSERFRTVYEPNGIAKFMDLRAVKSELHVGFDVLIIDESFCFISFPLVRSRGEDASVQIAIVFEEQTDLVQKLGRWFDNRVIPISIEIFPDVISHFPRRYFSET